jgi:hypothetical protein
LFNCRTVCAEYYVRAPDFGRFAPYFDLLWLRLATPAVSSVPRIMWYLQPGRSRTLPPRINTTLCSCRLCPTPGIYAVTSILFDNRTLATLRNAEFGFFGVTVFTTVQTPRFCGQFMSIGRILSVFSPFNNTGAFDLFSFSDLPFLTNWLNVGK